MELMSLGWLVGRKRGTGEETGPIQDLTSNKLERKLIQPDLHVDSRRRPTKILHERVVGRWETLLGCLPNWDWILPFQLLSFFQPPIAHPETEDSENEWRHTILV